MCDSSLFLHKRIAFSDKSLGVACVLRGGVAWVFCLLVGNYLIFTAILNEEALMRIPSLALLLLLFFSNFSYAGSLRAVEVVALTGDIALGSSGATFTGFESAYILLNDFGQVVFGGKLDSSSSTNAGIWSNGGGNGLALIAREGDIAPGTGSDRFFISFVTSFNDFGQTGLFSILNNNSLNTDHGIWSEGGSGLALVARGGSVAPVAAPFFKLVLQLSTTRG